MTKKFQPLEGEVAAVLKSFPCRRRYLIGVSGGRDSVALLDLLVSAGYRDLIVCHFNHRLRGRASAADARFVAHLAKKQNLMFEITRVDVARAAMKRDLSIETAARQLRYEFFARVAREKRCRTIFLAHHADDQVETFLFNLFRGTGAAGLAAMRFDSIHAVSGTKLRVVRPLLEMWRVEIDAYAASHRLKFREDASNRELMPARNRMRRQIIPALEKMLGRKIKPAILRAASILTAENEWLRANVKSFGTEIPVKSLREMPLAIQRRTIYAWLQARKVRDVGFDEVEAARHLLAADAKRAKVNLPGDRHLRRRAGTLFIE